jgi:hypothetical protein
MTLHVISALFRFARDIVIDTARILPLALIIVFSIVCMASPWILLFSGGWRLFLRWYLLPYPFVLLGFGLIMAFSNRRELLVRLRNWRAIRKSEELELKKVA